MFSIIIPISNHIAFGIHKNLFLKNYYTKNMFIIRALGFTSLVSYKITDTFMSSIWNKN